MTTKKKLKYKVESNELHSWKKFQEARRDGVKAIESRLKGFEAQKEYDKLQLELALKVEKEVLALAQKKVSELSKK